MNFFDLTGKVAIVTGGYGHLGKAMTLALLEANATVIVAGRNKEKFENAFAKTEKKKLFFSQIDITDTSSVEKCFKNVVSEFGNIDILINNAHTARGNSQEAMLDDDWNYTMEGVLGSAHRTIRTIIPVMKKQQSGKIINITSMYGLVSPNFSMYKGENCEKYTNPPHYGAAKAGMVQLTKYYAVLLGPSNIQVNAIAPGPFPKEIIQKENPQFIERLKSRNPLHKIGNPDDLAGVTLLLASSASDFITGQTLQIDGGWTLW